MSEKQASIVHKIIWASLVIFVLFIPWLDKNNPRLMLMDSNVAYDYYSYSNTSMVDVDLTFNRDVSEYGSATIEFYDNNHKSLGLRKIIFFNYYHSNYNTTVSGSTTIAGKINSYSIINYDFKPYSKYSNLYFLLLIVIPCLIGAFLISYKQYNYNGINITIYSGWYHHTLRVNGKLSDEHNSIFSFTPFRLCATLDDGTKLEASVTLTNRISLKINDKLIQNK